MDAVVIHLSVFVIPVFAEKKRSVNGQPRRDKICPQISAKTDSTSHVEILDFLVHDTFFLSY